MKILLPLVVIAVFAITVTSCKKRDYVCTCKENHGGNTVMNDYPLGNINDNTAQNECAGTRDYLEKKGITASCYTTF